MNRLGTRPEPPYARIVREIRRRITTGELRAGDRVPSTRQITQEWGVAMATATKVLATLRQEGLVQPKPGVGTVVRVPEPGQVPVRGREPAPAVDGEHEPARARLVRTAIEIADAEGIAALSMRRAAAALGLPTMSLYRHVQSKEELVLLMADAVFGAEFAPVPSARTWRERLELAARQHWAMYRRHSWLAQVQSFTRPLMSPNALAGTEWVMQGLTGLGLRPNEMLHTVVTVYSYVHGVAVNLEGEAQARQESGVTDDEWMAAHAPAFDGLFTSGRFPAFSQVLQSPGVELDLDSLFEFGLRSLLDGVAVRVQAARGRPGRR
ncbi:GntR family transcriptional regulator [Sphaerisporangium melleum]|uniref:GntR family transcriptional regulator n=1 Tax=Sphaerisporangium melleum TaxID=321316 RepID=A0A917RFF1_9ACTN|nr:TetR/AcrR family transcriptional regulator C-terminal domain-containing protein [Sphaerisporangium melleum]GGL03563.1 GntR family transcriptional regulator [Sphaerisporangium melleum]GII74047.1 GntR family transcriptional regulator [Sphaerisporangium melleum]